MATVNQHRSSSLSALFLSGALLLSAPATGRSLGGTHTTAGAGQAATATPDHRAEERESPLCDDDYVAEVVELDVEKQRLADFVRHLNEKYRANIALDQELGEITFSMAKVRGSWLALLKVVMKQNRLKEECKAGIARIRRRK